MDNQNYSPDRKWTNIWTILRSNRNSKIVLSCKDCPGGVSPKSSKSMFAWTLLLVFLCPFVYFSALHSFIYSFVESMTSNSLSNIIKEIITILIAIPVLFAIVLIIILLAFRLSKWVPANTSCKGTQSNTVCK